MENSQVLHHSAFDALFVLSNDFKLQTFTTLIITVQSGWIQQVYNNDNISVHTYFHAK